MDFSNLSNRKKRQLGAVIGVHAGDCLGASLEFTPWEQARQIFPDGLTNIIGGGPFGWPAGHATDDTDLTRAVLLAYAMKSPEDQNYDVVRAAANHMLEWMHGNWPGREQGTRPVDIGGATLTGLRNYSTTRNPKTSGAGQNHAGNGSLMRCIPTALYTHDIHARNRESVEISSITHDDVRCTISCAAYNTIVADLVDAKPPRSAIASAIACATELANSVTRQAPGLRENAQAVVKALERGQTDALNPQNLRRNGPGILAGKGSGYVLESLSIAVAALLDERSFEEVICDIAMLGADADTNCAIAGGVLGAYHGIESIPQHWISQLQFAGEFIQTVSAINF